MYGAKTHQRRRIPALTDQGAATAVPGCGDAVGRDRRAPPAGPAGRSASPGRSRRRACAGPRPRRRSRRPRRPRGTRQPCPNSTSDSHELGQDGIGVQPGDDAPVDLDDVGGGDDDVPQRGEAGADVVDREPEAPGPEGLERGLQRGVVLDLVVLGQLEQHPGERQPAEQFAALGREQRGRRDVHRDVAVDAVEVLGRPLQREQFEPVAETDAVRLLEDDVGRHAPLGREAAERLGADPVRRSRGRRSAAAPRRGRRRAMTGRSRSSISAAPLLRAHLGLDDHRGRRRQDVHQRLVPLGEVPVGGESGRAERAVQAAVAEGDRYRDVAAQPRHPRRGQLHGLGEDRRSGMTCGIFLSRIAWQRVALLLLLVPSWNRNGTEVSTTSRCWVVPSSRLRNATLSRSDCLRLQQFGDLLLGGGALSAHGPSSRSGGLPW